MVMRQIGQILRNEGPATLDQLAVRTGANRPMVTAALDYWIQRGTVHTEWVSADGCGTADCGAIANGERRQPGATCASCPLARGCTVPGATGFQVYQWRSLDVDQTAT